MRKNHQGNKEASALHDIVFLMSAGFFVLFMVAFFYVNPVAKLGKIDSKAEFIITVSWPDDIDVDIDTWVEDPNGTIISFQSKAPNESAVHLDRDDLGESNDTIMVNGNTIIIEQNQETVTIRGIIPGRYVVNLHYYSSKIFGGVIPVTVKIEKINPIVRRIFYTQSPILLEYQGQEKTVVHFVVELDGEVSDISTEPPISLLTKNNENRSNSYGDYYDGP